MLDFLWPYVYVISISVRPAALMSALLPSDSSELRRRRWRSEVVRLEWRFEKRRIGRTEASSSSRRLKPTPSSVDFGLRESLSVPDRGKSYGVLRLHSVLPVCCRG